MKTSMALMTGLLLQVGIGQAQLSVSHFPEAKTSSKWIKMRGGKFNYTEQGSSFGVPVIMLHGYSDSRISFDAILPHLPASVHVFAISMRGYGDSYKPDNGYQPEEFSKDLATFMDRLQIKSAVILGHSLGSIVAQRFALDHPKKTKAVILMSAFSSFPMNEAATGLAKMIQGFDSIDSGFVRKFQESTVAKEVEPGYFNRMVQESMKVPLHVWQETISGFMKEDYTAVLEHIYQPVLIIWGDQDQVCTKKSRSY